MIIRILIALILLLSVLNIIGQPTSANVASHIGTQGFTNQDAPASLVSVIELLSGFTILLLSQNYLKRRLKKINAASARYRLSKRSVLRKTMTNTPDFSNSWQQA